MIFRIEPGIFSEFPDLHVGVISARGIDNRGEDDSETGILLRQAEAGLFASFHGVSVTDHPHISAWREAYRKFGAKPKKHLSSVESLARRVLRGQPLRHINRLVDVYNAVSLRHLLPVGGEDLDRIEGNIVLTFAGESEAPVRTLGETEETVPQPGEVIYRDRLGTICRRWNWKEAERTKLTRNTVNAVLVIEALPPATLRQLETALTELVGWVKRYCSGEIRATVLHEGRRDAEL